MYGAGIKIFGKSRKQSLSSDVLQHLFRYKGGDDTPKVSLTSLVHPLPPSALSSQTNYGATHGKRLDAYLV